MTLFQAFIDQLILFVGTCICLVIVQKINGDTRRIIDMWPENLSDIYSLYFIMFLWFGLGTFYRQWTELPLLGIWGYLLYQTLDKDRLSRRSLLESLMMTLFQAFIGQCKLFLLCIVIVLIRYNGYDLEELFKDFKNKYFTTFMIFLWFLIFPCCIYYWQLPEYGMWSYLLQ